MAIEKGLYEMPEGIDGELMGEMGEEMTPDAMVGWIDVVTEGDLPVMVELEDGSVEISFWGRKRRHRYRRPSMQTSLSILDEGQLKDYSWGSVEEAIDADDFAARRDWADSYVAGA
jgi:hypothetical protein